MLKTLKTDLKKDPVLCTCFLANCVVSLYELVPSVTEFLDHRKASMFY